jgi:hypothetical protein
MYRLSRFRASRRRAAQSRGNRPPPFLARRSSLTWEKPGPKWPLFAHFRIRTAFRRLRLAGAVAQLGERLVRNEEVSGSIPLGSTSSHLKLLFLRSYLASWAVPTLVDLSAAPGDRNRVLRNAHAREAMRWPQTCGREKLVVHRHPEPVREFRDFLIEISALCRDPQLLKRGLTTHVIRRAVVELRRQRLEMYFQFSQIRNALKHRRHTVRDRA